MVPLTINPCDRYAGSLIMTVTYGHLADESLFLSRAHEIVDVGKQALSPEKAAMFTAFPFLEKLPFWCFGGALAMMGRCRELSQQLLNEPFNEVKAQIMVLLRTHQLLTFSVKLTTTLTKT